MNGENTHTNTSNQKVIHCGATVCLHSSLTTADLLELIGNTNT